MKYFSSSFSLRLSATLLISCGSGSSSSNTITTASTGVLVDLFIEDAILCEDINKNNLCDDGEQLSTPTDANGNFTFQSKLSADSNVITKQQGFHNNVPYTLPLGGVVDIELSLKIQIYHFMQQIKTQIHLVSVVHLEMMTSGTMRL